MAEERPNEKHVTGRERDADWYDRVFEKEKEGWSKEYNNTSYYAMWSVMADRLQRQDVRTVLDIGCGPGQFAALLRDKGIQSYKGVDFSPKRIERAREVCPEFEFSAADAFTVDLFDGQSYDAVVCGEFLEHVERDLEILERIPSGTRVLLTVPNFPHDEHVRYFEDTQQVSERYGGHLEHFDLDVFTGGRATHRFFLMDGVRRHDSQGLLAERDRELSELKQQLNELRSWEEQLEELRIWEAEWQRLEEDNQSKEAEVFELKQQIKELRSFRNKERPHLEEASQKKSEQSPAEREQINRAYKDVEKLSSWIKRLEDGISALLNSRRWRTGWTIGELHRKLTLRSLGPTAPEHLESILQEFRDWEKSNGSEDKPSVETAENNKSLLNGATAGAVSLPSSTVESGGNNLLPQQNFGEKTGTKVSVLAWDVGHNPMGRAYLLAEVLRRKFDVEIIGARFPRYGTEVWEPTRNGEVPVTDFPGCEFPPHFAGMEEMAQRIDGDVILVSKPRLPSYELGILAKQLDNRPLILDVDDHELAFFQEQESLTLKEAGKLQEDRGFLTPYEKVWTRYCEGIIPLADGITVSNSELQRKYGGEIVPHARDETVFDPALYDRDSIRAKFGLTPEDRVILFIGTPRLYKGVVDIAEALARLGDPRYKLCIIGTIKDKDLRARLENTGGDHVKLFEDQPYKDLPSNLSIGDLVCLLQNPDSEVSQYQMPAKFTDALAMGIPILATDVPPLREPASVGLVELLGDSSLEQKIEEIFSNYAQFKEKASRNREAFLQEYSYAAAAEKLESALLPTLASPLPLPKEFKRLLRFHRQLFAPSRNGSGQHTYSGNGVLPEASKNGAAPSAEYADDKYDIVFFWKQNDTGIYGRRQDTLIKYLSKMPQVNKIVHFDAPIDAKTLFSLQDREENSGTDQSNLVFLQTISRLLGEKDSEKIKYYTYVRNLEYLRNGSRNSRTGGWSSGELQDYLQYLEDVLEENGIGERKTIFWVCPTTNFDFREIVASFNPDLVVADVIDDQRAWKEPDSPQREAQSKNYEQILSISDVTLANCEPVRQSMLEYSDDVRIVPNALELPEDDTDPEPPEEFQGLEGPIIGYVGNLSSRIDIDLLEHVAVSRPDWNLVLIGSTHLSTEILRLDVYKNVHFLGVKKYNEAKQYIKGFDVAMVPHLDNEMTRSMNPLKVFVYFSLNIPVVSTEIENLGELRDMVHVAQDPEDFVRKTELALQEERNGELSAEHMELLRRNSWEDRVETIMQIIEEELFATAQDSPRSLYGNH